MIKIKLYIVTYNNSQDLNNNLESLLNSDIVNYDYQIHVINNHTKFCLNDRYLQNTKINVLHNVCRPDFSTGHLSRNWNQAIINGFVSLNNPNCDIVAHCQDDSIFTSNWVEFLVELHQNYNFIQMGIGDNFCSYLPSAIKKVGLWDERFCGLGYQEADYFLRHLIYNKDKACINDLQHGRFINAVNFSFCSRPAPPNIFSPDHHKSMEFHTINEKVFRLKWPNTPPNYWNSAVFHSTPTHPAIPSFITYPFFEKDIPDLKGKGYVI